MNSPFLTSADLGLYLATRQIANLIFALATQYKSSGRCEIDFFEDWRHEGPSCPSQTAQGLYLHIPCELPSSMYTPWGKWDFRGGAYSKGKTAPFVTEILERLGAVRCDHPGLDGKLYEIHRIENLNLPHPKMKEGDKVDSYQACRDQWAGLSKMYVTLT